MSALNSATTSDSTLEIGHSNQDLIISKGKKKKQLWILGCLGIILVCVALMAGFIIFVKTPTLGYNLNGPTLTLEEILNGKLNPSSFNASWISGNELIYREPSGSIKKFNVETGKSDEILSASYPVLATAFEYELSPDHKYLLIAHDYQKLYRYSYVSQYTVVNLETKASSKVLALNEPVLQYATWGPVGNSIVYVAHYNIFYRPNAASGEFRVITSDGSQGHVYNGIPDWVYEEEVFSSNKAVWFSPNGTKFAYAKFNDTTVPIMTIPVYGTPGNFEFQYPRAVQIRYPKPGTKNPDVSLYVVDVNYLIQRHLKLEAPDYLGREPILAAVTWADEDTVCAIWKNRIQNEANIVLYRVSDNGTEVTSVKKLKEQNGWLELFTAPIFSRNGKEMLLILPQKQGKSGAYRHVVRIDSSNETKITALTKGLYTVTEILAWDEKNDLIYYQATTEDPAVQHVYSVSKNQIRCLTCNATTSQRNTTCTHNTGKFSLNNRNFVMHCSGPHVPETSVYNASGRKLLVWEPNLALAALLDEKFLPETKRYTFDVPGGGKAQVMLKLPPNADLTGVKKYPMLINVYGGPNSNQVSEKFNLDWGSYLAANKSIIYGMIDGRGSGLKGDDMLFALFNKLGSVEVVDQINVTKQIQNTLPFVDSKRTAIWGWSYGGYASGMALSMDTEGVFKCGISVAPVTDWALYDSIYTERFMGLPSSNFEGYKSSQLLLRYEGLRNKSYYLVHGTLDDNVHYQQSMLWSRVLEENDIIFRQQSYTDQDHGLGLVRPHLYHSLERFLEDCFDVDSKVK